MRRAMTLAMALVLAPVFSVAGGCRSNERPPELILATTTSVANSGLLDVLLEAFEQERGIVGRSHLVGSGLALGMLEKGDADVAITHAPDAEAAMLQRHPGWRYRKFMFNDFVLVGPSADPAGVRGSDTPEEAMRRIARSDERFISRGDSSGTHEREEQLWMSAGIKPPPGKLVAAGAGMGTTLRIASETGAYTLTDRATLAQSAGAVQLVILFERHPRLINTYAVTLDSARAAPPAVAFYDWLIGAAGRRVIHGYRVGGVQGFTVWPPDTPAERPDAQPRVP